MITESDIHKLINQAKEQVNNSNTNEYSPGKLHHHLSKAFVAAIGHHLKFKYNSEGFEVRFQDYKNGKSVSGEWLFDAVVVRNRIIINKNSEMKYAYQVAAVVESEMAEGIKAFFDDFPKLLVVNAEFKIYINGVKANNKEKYTEERIKLIKVMLERQGDNSKYTIVFVDHPSFWKTREPFIKICNLDT